MTRFLLSASFMFVLTNPAFTQERTLVTLEAIGATGTCATAGLTPLEFARNPPNGEARRFSSHADPAEGDVPCRHGSRLAGR
jgi:hypothetical protein